MHEQVLDWVGTWAPRCARTVLDIGGRDINGNPRHLFHEDSEWISVDLADGPMVTIVGDVLDIDLPKVDVVLCLEVAEHTEKWPKMVARAAQLLNPGGRFIFTAAGPGRGPHSAIDGGDIKEGEWYENVTPTALAGELDVWFGWFAVQQQGADVRAVAKRPKCL